MNGSQPTDAYAKAVMNAGAIALPMWGTLRVSGADRASFLHNLCTNHIRDLVPGSGCEAFFTEVKGKVVAHAFVLCGAEEMLLLLSPGQIERLTTHLDRYIIREDVQLVDATAEVEWTLLVGPQATALLESIAGGAIELPAANWSHLDLPVGSASTRVVRCALPWCGGLLLASEREQADSCRLALENAGAARCGEGDWQTIRVESFWPLYGIDFDAANLAQECGRDAQAIHLRKGCYLGQETVARIDALGHVNKRLMQIETEEPPPAPGCEVLAGEQAVGRVTSACWSPRRKAPLALAMLRHGVDSREKALTCDGRAATVVDVR